MALSVISSGSRSITSSILKSSDSTRSRPSVHRVRFQLPSDLKSTLLDWSTQKNFKPYEDLVCIIRDSDIQDDDLYQLLHKARECISLMNQKLHHFVDAVLKVKWTHRSDKAVSEFQGFLIDLVSAHIYYTKNALDVLITNFKSGNDVDWINGVPSDDDKECYEKVHKVLQILLQIVPMASDLLKQIVVNHFPYLRRSPEEHERYIYNILRILEYQPHLRVDFFLLIVNRLIILDVNAPRTEIETAEEEFDANVDIVESEMFQMEVNEEMKDNKEGERMRHPVACNLDVALHCMFRYMYLECHDSGDKTKLNWNRTKQLYQDMVTVFSSFILPTHATHHIQFLMFYLCSFKVTVAETFINFLWGKVSSVSVPPVIRQTAVFYIASLLARAMFIPLSTVKAVLAEMSSWIDNYISNQDGLACVNSDIRVHLVFYSVCQALFYIIAFRHRDLINTKNNLIFLQSLNLTKIVTSRLNPLKICLPAVVQNFAAVTRTYQLAYCYTIMEHNARNVMPVIRRNEVGTSDGNAQREHLDAFFPFDPFILRKSGSVISPIYREYQGSVEEIASKQTPVQKEDDDDDFLSDQSVDCNMSSPVIHPDFTYGTSPGFKHM